MPHVPPIRVLLVDDDPMVRMGIRFLFDATDDLLVVAEASDGAEAIAATRIHRPDVVLMDLIMPRTDGIEATAKLRDLPNPPHVIALTTWDVDDAVLRALAAGASGYLLKTTEPKNIIHAVRAVVAGDAVLSPRSTRQLLDYMAGDQSSSARREAEVSMSGLTDREREIATLVGNGFSNPEIAGRLFLAEATVKTHLSTIQTKLDARNRVDIAVLAERAGLLRNT